MGLTIGKSGYNVTENFTIINNFPYGVGSGGTSSTITVDGLSYTMLTFTGSGTFTVTTAGMFDCMIMGGGAAGSGAINGNGGGGGGAGALVISQENYFAVGTYPVAVGGGGSISYVGKYASGRPLGPSQGGSGNTNASSPIVGGFSGGSGIGVGPNGGANGGGGGGGMGAIGTNANTNKGYGTMTNGGNGGAGVDWSLWRGQTAGTTYYGAGGGGSGGYAGSGGSGGTGGGGTGGGYYSDVATAGTANTGSGGGGGTEGASARAGGSGLVLIRFKN
jgi:hypothetical protein